MFEDKTYENLLQTCIDNAPAGIDTRKGSIFYDSVAAKCLLLAETYAELDTFNKMCHVNSAVGEELDECGNDLGVPRKAAESMRCRGIFVGVSPAVGSRFFVDGIFFVLKDNLNELYPNDEELLAGGNEYLEAETSGIKANSVVQGDALIPYPDIDGLSSATVGEIIVSGSDKEDDETYRERIKNKVGGPSENGNRNHYKQWCEERPGVGKARIFSLAKIENDSLIYDTPNWVTGVLMKNNGRTVDDVTVDDVQQYIDPDMLGLGEGVANLGAHFMAVKATEKTLDIRFSAELSNSSYALEDVKNEISDYITEYLRTLALTPITFIKNIANDVIIRIKQIGSLISTAETVMDYDNLEIRIGNESFKSNNINLPPNFIAVLGTITVTSLTSTQGGE